MATLFSLHVWILFTILELFCDIFKALKLNKNMKFSYKFSNLLGTIYRGGNLIFTPDGNSIVSPVGNRLTIYDLKKWVGKIKCDQFDVP